VTSPTTYRDPTDESVTRLLQQRHPSRRTRLAGARWAGEPDAEQRRLAEARRCRNDGDRRVRSSLQQPRQPRARNDLTARPGQQKLGLYQRVGHRRLLPGVGPDLPGVGQTGWGAWGTGQPTPWPGPGRQGSELGYRCLLGLLVKVRPFAWAAEDAEYLGGFVVGAAGPVRYLGGELGCLPETADQVLVPSTSRMRLGST
jgi:hypothetical protein